ncbi:hypothetical protein evm_004697 [Chilo suppressalis]|nr:hypothetical protein evm_004697 [Chilo suppressalis]
MSKATENSDTHKQISARQTDVLCTFFEENPEVIIGYKKTTKCINAVQSKWRKITPQLNSLGKVKDHRSWAKYLCNIKAKLRRKKIKWHQNVDGHGSIISNTDDFNEIELRMLQVLQKNAIPELDTQDVSKLELEIEDNVKADESSSDTIEHSWLSTERPANNRTFIKLLDSDSPLLETQVQTVQTDSAGDEFDTFGKNIAQQLRTLPIPEALETQEMLLSVLRTQRLKVLKKLSSFT